MDLMGPQSSDRGQKLVKIFLYNTSCYGSDESLRRTSIKKHKVWMFRFVQKLSSRFLRAARCSHYMSVFTYEIFTFVPSPRSWSYLVSWYLIGYLRIWVVWLTVLLNLSLISSRWQNKMMFSSSAQVVLEQLVKNGHHLLLGLLFLLLRRLLFFFSSFSFFFVVFSFLICRINWNWKLASNMTW